MQTQKNEPQRGGDDNKNIIAPLGLALRFQCRIYKYYRPAGANILIINNFNQFHDRLKFLSLTGMYPRQQRPKTQLTTKPKRNAPLTSHFSLLTSHF